MNESQVGEWRGNTLMSVTLNSLWIGFKWDQDGEGSGNQFCEEQWRRLSTSNLQKRR